MARTHRITVDVTQADQIRTLREKLTICEIQLADRDRHIAELERIARGARRERDHAERHVAELALQLQIDRMRNRRGPDVHVHVSADVDPWRSLRRLAAELDSRGRR